VAREGGARGQCSAGEAVRRALVRGQALSRLASALGGRPANGLDTDPAAAAAGGFAAYPRAAATGPAPGRGRGCGIGANQGSAGTAPTAEGDCARGIAGRRGSGQVETSRPELEFGLSGLGAFCLPWCQGGSLLTTAAICVTQVESQERVPAEAA